MRSVPPWEDRARRYGIVRPLGLTNRRRQTGKPWVGVLRIRGQFRLRSDTTSGCRLRNDWPVSRCPYVAGVGVCTLLSSVSHRTVYGPVVTSWYPFAPIVLASELLGSWSDLRWSRTQRKS